MSDQDLPVEQTLAIWRELAEARDGKNRYGGTVAEIYAYRLLPAEPSHSLPVLPTETQATIAATNLTRILRYFLEQHPSHEIGIETDRRVFPTLDLMSEEVPPFVHRIHVEVRLRVVDERALVLRDVRQRKIAIWARAAFGEEEATGIPQRGLRLLEEAVEAFQACGGDEAIAQKLVTFVFSRPPGTIAQELGGVAVTTLALAAAAGLSADEEECREVHRVLSKPVREFTERNARKNAAGFRIP